jgi:hypothetical protein
LTYRACVLALHQMDGALALVEEAERANGGAGNYAATSLAHIRIMTSLFDAPEQTAENLARQVETLGAAGLAPSFQTLNYVALTRGATADRYGTLEAVRAVEQELRRAGTDDGLPDLLITPAMLAYVLGEHQRARRWITAIKLASKPTQSLPITAMYRQLRARLGLSADQTGLADTPAVYREARAWLSTVADDHAPDHPPAGE